MQSLRSFRLARGWSQRELAAKIGLHQSQISRFETGGRGTRAVEALISGLMDQYPPIDPPKNAEAAPSLTLPPSPPTDSPQLDTPEDEPSLHCTRTSQV